MEMAKAVTADEVSLFAGYIRDKESGMDYLGMRYYNRGLYRFMQVDRIGGRITNGLSYNGYSYVLNNPMNLGLAEVKSNCRVEENGKIVCEEDVEVTSKTPEDSNKEKISKDKAKKQGISRLEKFFLFRYIKECNYCLISYKLDYYYYEELALRGIWVSEIRGNWKDESIGCYIDFNASGGYYIGATGGFIISSNQHLYMYIGGGIVLPAGISGAITYYPGEPSRGWNIAVQGTFFISSQIGYSFYENNDYLEYGAGYPSGITISLFYVWQLK